MMQDFEGELELLTAGLAIGDAWQGPVVTTSWETCGIASQHPADVHEESVVRVSVDVVQ